MADGPVVTPPKGPNPNQGSSGHAGTGAGTGGAGTGTGGTGSGGSGSGSGGGSSSSGGGGGGDPYGYRRKAATRYQEQAATLQERADSLLAAIAGFDKARIKRLRNVFSDSKLREGLIRGQYRSDVKSLDDANTNNNAAASTQSANATSTSRRERASAMSESAMQGAGESDMMQAQIMSLRNWQANQTEVSRAQFDTVQTINQSLREANAGTRTALTDNWLQNVADRDLVWTNYYNQRSQALTDLGNVYAQQAEALASAKEYGAKANPKGATKKSGDAFDQAAAQADEVWDHPDAPPDRIKNWKGKDPFRTENNTSKMAALPSVDLSRKPEGATLRSWE